MSVGKNRFHQNQKNSDKMFHAPETYGELHKIPMTMGMIIISIASVVFQAILSAFGIYATLQNKPISALAYTGISSSFIYIALPVVTWTLSFLFRFGCASIPLEMWRFPVDVKEGIIISKGRILKLITLLAELETSICFLYIAITLFLGYVPNNYVLLAWIVALVFSIFFPCKSAKKLADEAYESRSHHVDKKRP